MLRWSGIAAGVSLLFLSFLGFWFTAYAFVPPAAIVGGVVPESPAEKAGLLPGDAIAAVNGNEIGSFEDLVAAAEETSVGEAIYLTTYREGNPMGRATLTRPARVPGTEDTGGYWTGIDPPHRPVIGALAPRNPAELAGLQPGDEILSVNGQEVQFFSVLSQATAKAEGPVELRVLRAGREFTVTVTPVEVELRGPGGQPFLGPDGQPLKKKIIGVALDPSRYLSVPVTRAGAMVDAIGSVFTAPLDIVRAFGGLSGSAGSDPTRDRAAVILKSADTLIATTGWLALIAGIAMAVILGKRSESASGD